MALLNKVSFDNDIPDVQNAYVRIDKVLKDMGWEIDSYGKCVAKVSS